jgi:hypothetical protein
MQDTRNLHPVIQDVLIICASTLLSLGQTQFCCSFTVYSLLNFLTTRGAPVRFASSSHFKMTLR